ncbi:hypothetical protein C1H46_044045 [Malus baccata]|uniref:Uncharacterized protein n=1 Tax=Malus baccata TaxID=106549 RepID=A0A540K917_MALBA|nr:hypothetical protein C1H46_044045 [Malus baccata]
MPFVAVHQILTNKHPGEYGFAVHTNPSNQFLTSSPKLVCNIRIKKGLPFQDSFWKNMTQPGVPPEIGRVAHPIGRPTA